jgi:hypothetical protein
LGAALQGVGVEKNADSIGMTLTMDWDSDGAKGKDSLDKVYFNWAHRVLASTGKWTSRPVGMLEGRGDKGFIFESRETMPMHDVGRRETQVVWHLADDRSHSDGAITNSGFGLEEVVEHDRSRSGCLQLRMSMMGKAGEAQGWRSNAGSGTAHAVVPIECPGRVREDPLTAATARTIPSLAPHLDHPAYTTGAVTLVSPESGQASNTVGTDMSAPFLTAANAIHGSDDTSSAQNDIYGFRKLPQLGAFGSGHKATQVFIKGHLLNADLGGPARDRNLFLITGQANEDHKRQVEKQVKDLVLAPRNLVAQYHVHVRGVDGPYDVDVLGDRSCTYEYLNADFQCSYGTYKLYTDDTIEPNPAIHHPIYSRFNLAGFVALRRTKPCPRPSE